MLLKTFGNAEFGVEAMAITIDVDINNQGLPGSVIAGLPDSAVKESMQCVESTLKSNGISYARNQGPWQILLPSNSESGTALPAHRHLRAWCKRTNK
jgi:magnesium chelatase family protein